MIHSVLVCEIPGGFTPGYNIGSSDYRPTMEACWAKCMATPNCRSIDWWTSSGTCYISVETSYTVTLAYDPGYQYWEICDPSTGDLDPHFIITNPTNGEHFCFDYSGADVEKFDLLKDAKSGN